MKRVRVSTTVDAHWIERSRRLGFERDSDLLDAALQALVERDERERDLRALGVDPIGDDLALPVADVDWDDELPYDGDVPAEVLELARRRTRR